MHSKIVRDCANEVSAVEGKFVSGVRQEGAHRAFTVAARDCRQYARRAQFRPAFTAADYIAGIAKVGEFPAAPVEGGAYDEFVVLARRRRKFYAEFFEPLRKVRIWNVVKTLYPVPFVCEKRGKGSHSHSAYSAHVIP